MRTKTAVITLEEAKEWYKSDNTILKKIALRAFTEDELKGKSFRDITTFEEACAALDLDINKVNQDIQFLQCSLLQVDAGLHLADMYKIEIIRKALNGKDWTEEFTGYEHYIPIVQIVKQPIAEKVAKEAWMKVSKSFVSKGETYTILTGDYHYCDYSLRRIHPAYRDVADLKFLACKSSEIAKHMSVYFAEEIFNALYNPKTYEYMWL